MSETMLAANVAAIVAIRAQIEALRTQLCPLEDAVKIEMAERNAEEITAAGHVVRWKVVTSKRLDTAALKRRCRRSSSSTPRRRAPAALRWIKKRVYELWRLIHPSAAPLRHKADAVIISPARQKGKENNE